MVSRTADVIVIGDGLIGLSTARELAERGAAVVVVGNRRPGAATEASAGLLIPSWEKLSPAATPFFADSLDRYPAFVESLRQFDERLVLRSGVVERTGGRYALRERDGAVDNVRLLAAVDAACAASGQIRRTHELATSIDVSSADVVRVNCDGGATLDARHVVLAAGAWSARIGGLPRALPVRPLKGQMIALAASPLRQAVMGEDVYLVPRDSETLVGATVEDVGFDLTVSDDATRSLRAAAARLEPSLSGAGVSRAWTGLRPATPDLLPILGRDPDTPRLLYACGHSKNGVLLAPATAAALATLCEGANPAVSLEAFSIARFA
jgi:glycine/D-amino acid oxidase-like deaminating enzyme